jgi:hypothetical protein
MASKKKKTDYNKRMRISDTEKLRKKKINLIITQFDIREIMDESGEVTNDTIIQISFEGILINLSIATAIKLCIDLKQKLNIN